MIISVEVFHRAGAWAAWITAGAACRRHCGLGGRSLSGHGENRKLRLKFLTLALGALGLLLAEYQRLKLVLTLLTNVLEEGHGKLRTEKLLSSI